MIDEQTDLRRLNALTAYRILDTPREESFDDLTDLASLICQTPIALISLIDIDRQWFKSEKGLGVPETARDISVCTHAIDQDQPLYVVADMAADPRFAAGPLVARQPPLRFYAGAVLRNASGVALGTLCVLDHWPRPEGLTSTQAAAMLALARQVVSLMELRRALAERRDSEARARNIADAMPQMVWSTRPDGHHDYYNARWYEFTGVPEGSTDGEAWNGMFHPDDQPLAWERWNRSLTTGEPYEIEYRLRHHSGEYRWTLGRALPIRGPDGGITRWFGTCTDIHEHKRLVEQQQILSRELSHRIKNIFSVVSGLVALSARRFPHAADFARDLRERIVSLGRAHDFVRPQAASASPDHGSLFHLIGELMSAYQTGDADRLIFAGDDARIDDQAATPLALVFHELATNAAKYGALSVSEGRIVILGAKTDGRMKLLWTETGGPPITAEPTTEGFGTTLSRLSVEAQLGGRITREWVRDGLVVTLEIPLASLDREG